MPPSRFLIASASGSYAVRSGWGLLGRLGRVLADAKVSGRRFVVSTPPVWKLHGHTLMGALPGSTPILVPDGERFKQTRTVGRIYDALVRERADRGSVIIAFGGGVVGDTAGFAAATFLRGVALVQVPTTLLAQVDSAIGGKVGVNHALGKNLIGAFHPPRVVAIDPQILDTLPRREFRAGLYEVVKYGVIASPSLFGRLDQELVDIFARKRAVLLSIIRESCQIKGRVVTADEREAGARRTLNFGHTIGHALEAVTKYRRFRHGEAVAYGMLGAAEIARARGTLKEPAFESLRRLLTRMGPLPAVGDLPIASILEAIQRDKKVLRGRLHVVLPTAIGRTTIVDDVSGREITRALKRLWRQS